MRKMKKFLALALAATMTISSMSVTSFAATISERPADGTTENQPFASGTGGSTNFRIPCLVTLDDGTIVAGCDARWNHSSDACGLDTIVSRSTDGGETWDYTFANYLGDNGNQFDYNSTAFIDPAMATDGETIWLVADLYPAGVAINTVPSNKTARPGHTGYTEDGELALALATDEVNGYSTSDARADASLYTYHLEKIEGAADDAESYYQIVDADGNVDDKYTVDAYFNIKGEGVDTNLFIIDSPYFPFPTDFLYMTKSTDGGATWSIPTLIDVKKADEQTLLVGPGRGIVTSTGRLIFTCYDFTYADDRSACLYSDDGGETWNRGADVANWSSEAVVTEAEDKLYMFTRHGNCYYISEDWGETWGPAISVDPAYNSNCQLSAITYSEKIDGKTAIILSAPSSTSSRSVGKLFLGLIQEDGTLEWVNEYKVTDGNYAYSCLDELENGNIALLYESAGSAITYKELDIKEVLGLVKNLDLSLGSTYVEEKAAASAPDITQKPDETIATATSELVVEEATTVLHNHVANSAASVEGSFSATADDTMNLEDAVFTFTASGDSWNIYNESADNYMVITNASSYYGDSAANLTITKVDADTENTGNEIFRISNSENRYPVFFDTNMVFDAWATADIASVTRTDVHFDLVLFEKQAAVSEDDIIPGYARATEVKDGGKYLITYLWDDSIIVLYPTNGQANQTKLVGETKTVSKSVVTITAVGIGETTAVIGDVTYNINVPDPKDDPAYSDDDYDVTKITYTTGSEQPASGNEGPVSYAFDNNTETFWHSEWSPSWPAEDYEDYLWVAMELEEATVVDAIRFLTRSGNGDITSYRVEAKTAESGDEWITLTEGDWSRGASEWKLAQFEPTEVTALRLVATATYADSGNNRFASGREIRVRTATLLTTDYRAELSAKVEEYGYLDPTLYTEESLVPFATALGNAMNVLANEEATDEELSAALAALEEAKENLVLLNPPVVEKTEIAVEHYTVSAGDAQDGEGPEMAIDGDSNTMWHTDWYAGDNHDNHWYIIELDSAYMVDGFNYLPRQVQTNGIITKYQIEVSLDGEEWTKVAEGDWALDATQKTAEFDAVKAKYVRLLPIEASSDQSMYFACAAEIRLTGTKVECAEHTTELVGKADATCTEDGHTGKLVCTNCGTVIEAGEVIPATGHSWGEWEVTKEATETEAGSKERVCETCGEKETEEIPVIGGEEPWENPFTDVAETKWYYNAVAWGSQNDVVAGMSEDKFAPMANSTRAQIVSFLWRAAGRPEPASTECKFTDVDSSKWYYKAVLWATENNYVAGYTETTFAPNATCKRAEMATFLWRMAGKPEAESSENPFIDVAAGKWYETAAQWTYENGIVSGYDLKEGKSFAPDNHIARAETVTMLYRFFK